MNEIMFMLENTVSDDSGAPKQFKILPLGLVKSQKGDFLVDKESFNSIRENFKERKLQIPIDYEHQTLKDMQAPAAGWIKELSLKPDGIYGTVEWTEKGAEYLTNREYKYCSPVVMARPSDRKAVKLHSVALTNTPAIDAMTPIVNADKPGEIEEVNEGQKPIASMAALAALLQLPESATIEDIYQAVSGLMETQTALKLKVDALQFESYKAEVESTIELALKDGKITPYQKDLAFQTAMNSHEDFLIWLKEAPQIIPMGRLAYPAKSSRGEVSRSDELLGLTPEEKRNFGYSPENR